MDGKSKAIIEHRKFGPNGIDYYYFPKTPSQVKSLNQNCLYPGRGPTTDEDGAGTSPDCIITEYNENGSPVNVPSTCVSVNTASSTDTGCIQTVDYIVNNEGEKELLQAQPDIPTCAEYLRDISS